MRARTKTNLILIFAISLTLLLILIPFLLEMYNSSASNAPVITKASADFSNSQINRVKTLYLSGEWLCFDGHIVSNAADSEGVYTQIPPSLSSLSTNSESGGCHSSYLIEIHGLDLNNAMIYIPNFAGTYTVFVDNIPVTQCGEYQDNTSTANMKIASIPVNFTADRTYQLVIEVSCEIMPGIYMTPVISDYDFATGYSDIAKTIRAFVAGIILFLGVFILFYSIKNNNLFSSKWLPVLCLFVAIRMMISTEGYSAFNFLFSSVSYERMTLLICMSTFIIKLIALLFYSDTLDMKIKKSTFISVSVGTLICTLITTVFPFIFFNPYYYIIIQVAALPLDIILLNHLADSVIRRVPYSKSYLFGYIALISGIMIDALYTNGLIDFASSYFMPLFFTFFIIVFVCVFFEKISKIHSASLKAVELDKELLTANTAIMISQIQPHFLYNALNTIKYLIKRDPKTAEKAVISFSKYLRGNMDSITQKAPITFSEELEHIKNYCDIELLRFGDKLEIIYDTDFVDFSVPSLTIQPLVENAIKHGVTKKAEGGFVKLSTALEENYYSVIIEDNGIGFDPQNPDYTPDDNRSHIGIQNVTNRLRAMVNAEIIIESEIDVGTKITIKIPKES